MDKVKEETECELYDNYECNAYYDIYPEPEDCQRDLCRTHENCYYRQLKRLERQYEDVLKLAKENADSNEFCIKELERENEELQEQLDKNFKLCSDCSITHSFNLQISENKKIQAENEKLYEENAELKAELKNFQDMAKKGLDEFKDVGGCWGCGLQLQLNQDMEDIKQLKAECELLKEEKQELSIEIVSLTSKLFTLEKSSNDLSQSTNKLYKALQEIRDIILSPEIIDEETKKLHTSEELDNIVRWHREDKLSKIKDKINSVIGEK